MKSWRRTWSRLFVFQEEGALSSSSNRDGVVLLGLLALFVIFLVVIVVRITTESTSRFLFIWLWSVGKGLDLHPGAKDCVVRSSEAVKVDVSHSERFSKCCFEIKRSRLSEVADALIRDRSKEEKRKKERKRENARRRASRHSDPPLSRDLWNKSKKYRLKRRKNDLNGQEGG